MTDKQKMTSYELWSLITQAVSTVLVVVSLWFIYYQTGQSTEAAKRQAYVGSLTQMSAIDGIFVEHPEMYPYFYEGKAIAPDHEDYLKVLTIAMAVTNFLEGSLPPEGEPSMHWWETYVRDQFEISPIMCEYLERRNAWFNPKLVKIMREARQRTNLPH